MQIEMIPSKAIDIVDSMRGATIVGMKRFSWWPPEEAVIECEMDSSEVFSCTEGPILLYLNSGVVIGFASDESKNSISLWFERDPEGNIHSEDIENDEEFYSVSFDDPVFSCDEWGPIEGQKIVSMELIKRFPINVKYEGLPNEVGVRFLLEAGGDFAVCHRLCQRESNLGVVKLSSVDSPLLEQLEFQRL